MASFFSCANSALGQESQDCLEEEACLQSLEMWVLSIQRQAAGGGTSGDFYTKGRGEGLPFVNFIVNGCQSPQTVMNAPHALGSGPHASE